MITSAACLARLRIPNMRVKLIRQPRRGTSVRIAEDGTVWVCSHASQDVGKEMVMGF